MPQGQQRVLHEHGSCRCLIGHLDIYLQTKSMTAELLVYNL